MFAYWYTEMGDSFVAHNYIIKVLIDIIIYIYELNKFSVQWKAINQKYVRELTK